MGKQNSRSTTFLRYSFHPCVCGLKPTCADLHHQCHSCAACHSRKGPMKGAPPRPSCHLLCSLSSLTAWLTPFPLSAPRYNVTCHQGTFQHRRDPAAGCRVVRASAERDEGHSVRSCGTVKSSVCCSIGKSR